MAKKRNRRGRDPSAIARAVPALPRVTPSLSPVDLSIFEDRRTYHPERAYRPARTFSGPAARPVLTDKPAKPSPFQSLRKFSRQTKAKLTFQAPDHTLICVRRHRRKEVLHALRKAGKRGQRKPKRNFYSAIACR